MSANTREELLKLRKEKGLKQEDVAKAMGISTSYFGMIEKGVRSPSLKLALRLSDFFGCPIEKLFS